VKYDKPPLSIDRQIDLLISRGPDRNIYNTLVMLGYMLNLMSPGVTWSDRVRQLVEENSLVNPAYMGFPPSCQEMSLWGGEK